MVVSECEWQKQPEIFRSKSFSIDKILVVGVAGGGLYCIGVNIFVCGCDGACVSYTT